MAAEFVELDAGIKTRALSELDVGIRGIAAVAVTLSLGITGSVPRLDELDAGITGRVAVELDAGIRSLAGATLPLGIHGSRDSVLGGGETAGAKVVVTGGAGDLSLRTSLVDIYTEVKVLFAYDYQKGEFSRSLTFVNLDAQERYGKNVLEYTAPFLRDNHSAVDLGTRLAKYYTFPRWGLDTERGTFLEDLRLGEEFALDHPLFPPVGEPLVVLEENYRPTEQTQVIVSEYVLRQDNAILIKELGKLVDQDEDLLSFGAVDSGVVRVKLKDPDTGAPIVNREVLIDGNTAATTNSAGYISFKATKESHFIVFSNGQQTFRQDFQIP